MERYLAVIWNSYDPDQRAAAEFVIHRIAETLNWQEECGSSGLKVFRPHSEMQSRDLHHLRNNVGVIIGAFFQRTKDLVDGATVPMTLGQETTTQIIQSGGRALVDRYWGSYVAFLRDPTTDCTWVVRSALAHIPCFRADFRHVHLYFSGVEDLAALSLLKLTINWAYMAAFLVCGSPRGAETGISEVSELHLGECNEISADRDRRSFYWDPRVFAKSDPIEDISEATRALRATTRACVHTWASRYDRIIHRLSGGLDSSVLLSCLMDAPGKPGVTSLHYYAPGAYGDERRYARSAAQRLGCTLVERSRDSQFRVETLLRHARTCTPLTHFAHLGHDPSTTRLATELGATANFSGNLGDILFHCLPAAPAATEYLWRHGPTRPFFKHVLDAAERDRVSFWQVLRDALRDGWLRPPSSHWIPRDLRGFGKSPVTAEVIAAIQSEPLRFVHPWLHSVDDVPPGKVLSLTALAFDSFYNDPLLTSDDPEPVRPFISEPLVELCLAIPTYVLTHNGWDRAALRLAFSADLPTDVLYRTTKGTPDGWVRDIVTQNATEIRELLLDGALAREGLLDRQALAGALPGATTKNTVPTTLVLRSLCAETWTRNWLDTHQQVVS